MVGGQLGEEGCSVETHAVQSIFQSIGAIDFGVIFSLRTVNEQLFSPSFCFSSVTCTNLYRKVHLGKILKVETKMKVNEDLCM